MSTAGKEITLHIELIDGTKRTIKISDTKPTSALYEMISQMVNEEIGDLVADFSVVPRVRQMIKYVPLEDGDTLIEKGPRKPKRHNEKIRQLLREGKVSEDDVSEIKFTDSNGREFYVMVHRDDPVSMLKDLLQQVKGPIYGYLRLYDDSKPMSQQDTFLGYTGDIRANDRDFKYDGSRSFRSYGIKREAIVDEVQLPYTYSQEKRAAEKTREWQEAVKKAAERQQSAWRREVEEEEREYERMRQQQQSSTTSSSSRGYSEEERRRYEEERKRHEENFFRRAREAQRAREAEQRARYSYHSSSSSGPQTTSTTKKSCEQRLRDLGITTKKEFKKWSAQKGHPNKGGNLTTFQEINNCNDEMELIYGDDWVLPKRGGRRKSRTTRVKRSVRKRRGTHKKKHT